MAPGVEFADINWLAVGIMVVVNVVLGFIWYAPKVPTGKIWMKHMKLPEGFKPTTKAMVTGIVLAVVGAFFLMFVYFHNFVAYEDAYKLDQSDYQLTIMDGVMGAVFTWMGFILPLQFSAATWEGKPWPFVAVNAGYYLVTLLIAGILFVTMGVN